MSKSPLSAYPYIIYIFAGLIALGPFGTDTYLPAFLSVAEYFHIGIDTVQLTLVVFLIGGVLGQFLGGPISDGIGRFKVALIGSILFLLASLSIIFATQLEVLLIARAVQGFASGAAGVVVSAIIANNYQGKEAGRMMASATLVLMCVPLIAPIIGTYLLKFGDWHEVFWFLLLYSAVLVCAIVFYAPTKRLHKPPKQPFNLYIALKNMMKNYHYILSKPHGRLVLLGMGTNVAIYFVFSTSAAFVYMDYLSVSLEMFPFLIGMNTISLIAGNRLGVFLLKKMQPLQVCVCGSSLTTLFCLMLCVSVLFFEPSVYTIVPFVILAAGAIPISGPQASAAFMQFYDKHPGTASATMGVARTLIGALCAFLVTLLFNQTLYPMVFIMFSVAVVSLLSFIMAVRRIN